MPKNSPITATSTKTFTQERPVSDDNASPTPVDTTQILLTYFNPPAGKQKCYNLKPEYAKTEKTIEQARDDLKKQGLTFWYLTAGHGGGPVEIRGEDQKPYPTDIWYDSVYRASATPREPFTYKNEPEDPRYAYQAN